MHRKVNLLNCSVIQLFNQPFQWQQLSALAVDTTIVFVFFVFLLLFFFTYYLCDQTSKQAYVYVP